MSPTCWCVCHARFVDERRASRIKMVPTIEGLKRVGTGQPEHADMSLAGNAGLEGPRQAMLKWGSSLTVSGRQLLVPQTPLSSEQLKQWEQGHEMIADAIVLVDVR